VYIESITTTMKGKCMTEYVDAVTGSPVNVEDQHDNLLDEIYPLVTIGIYQWEPSRVLKMMDPVAYRVSLIEWVDQMLEDGKIVEV
jgi:hypothetical protein